AAMTVHGTSVGRLDEDVLVVPGGAGDGADIVEVLPRPVHVFGLLRDEVPGPEPPAVPGLHIAGFVVAIRAEIDTADDAPVGRGDDGRRRGACPHGLGVRCPRRLASDHTDQCVATPDAASCKALEV